MAAENIRYNASLGGGAILDNLIYPLSLCLNITGRSPENYQFTIKHDEEYQVDARGFLLLNFGDIAANVNYGFGLSYQNSYSIWGSEGRIRVNRAFTMPGDFTGEIIIETKSNKEVLLVEPADHFSLMLDSFAEKISGSENSGINEGNDILKRMRIISDLYIASKSSPYIK
jgi:predicted dehydrogenase